MITLSWGWVYLAKGRWLEVMEEVALWQCVSLLTVQGANMANLDLMLVFQMDRVR